VQMRGRRPAVPWSEIHTTDALYLIHVDPVSASALLAIAAVFLLPVCICNKVDSNLRVADCHLGSLA